MLTGLRERGPHPSIGDQVGGASHPTGNRLTQAGGEPRRREDPTAGAFIWGGWKVQVKGVRAFHCCV